MKRIIKTYETCSDELLGQLAEAFPNGIKPRHLQQFTTIKGDRIKVVELATEETVYLIKFSEQLEEAIDNFDIEELDDDLQLEDDDEGLSAKMAMEEAENMPDDADID